MKKRKYLIGLALAALSLTTLVSCGDDESQTPLGYDLGCIQEPFDEERVSETQ